MNTRHLRRLLASMTMVALIPVLAGCGGGTQASALPSAARSVAQSEAPSVSPSAASSSQSPSARCTVATKSFSPPTDQLVSMEIVKRAGKDQVIFKFGPDSGQPVSPRARLRAVKPPFTFVASGQPASVKGKRFVEVRFSGMYLFDAYGNDAFQGALDRHPKSNALRDVISIDSFEGHMTWIMGYNGDGCVTVRSNRAIHTVTVEFEVR